MDGKSLTPQEEKLQQLKEILPEAFAEGKVDWEKLKATLGEDINFANERYVLNWAGKSEAFKVLQAPTTKTLVPDKKESVNFDETENIFIEGENLEVLKVLQKSYFGKVKMIYIDPPYNTGNDSFIYPDKFSETKAEYEKRVGDKDEEGYLTKDGMFRKNSKENGQYHSNWLNMMYPRLFLAKNLLCQNGIILIHIDENEINNLELICSEIFGEENNMGTIIWDKGNPKGDSKSIASQHEYIVGFFKNKEAFFQSNTLEKPKKNAQKILNKASKLFPKLGKISVPDELLRGAKKYNLSKETLKPFEKDFTLRDINQDFYRWIQDQKSFSGGEKAYNKIDKKGDVYRTVSMAWPNKKKAPDEYFIPLVHPITKKECPVPSRGWRYPLDTMKELLKNNNIIFGEDENKQPERKYLLKENMMENIPSILFFGGSDDKLFSELSISFENPKPYSFVKELVTYFSSENDIILDFFAGSGTLAHAILDLNVNTDSPRKFICVQLDEKTNGEFESIAKLSRKRIELSYTRVLEKLEESKKEFFEETQGFKSFSLSPSNFKQWQPNIKTKEQLEKQMNIFKTSISTEINEENVILELLLKSGISLNEKISLHNNMWVSSPCNYLFITRKFEEEQIDIIKEIKPHKVLALDSSFENKDVLRTNLALSLKDINVPFKTF